MIERAGALERDQGMDAAAIKFGLLMESAQAHQKLAETQLERLRVHTQDLDGVVRDEIRRTLVEELQLLGVEIKGAADALRRVRRNATLRSVLWSVLAATLCAVIPIAISRWAIPSASEITALHARRDQLALSIAALEQRGGRIEWRHCGEASRLCVRVDRKAPSYGEKADYYVVAGY